MLQPIFSSHQNSQPVPHNFLNQKCSNEMNFLQIFQLNDNASYPPQSFTLYLMLYRYAMYLTHFKNTVMHMTGLYFLHVIHMAVVYRYSGDILSKVFSSDTKMSQCRSFIMNQYSVLKPSLIKILYSAVCVLMKKKICGHKNYIYIPNCFVRDLEK